MASNFGFDPNLPPEIAAENERISRQQAVAQAMMQRGMTPLPTNQGPLHWTQGIAQIFNAYSGRRGMEASDSERRGLGDRYKSIEDAELRRIDAMRRGTPASSEQIVDEQANGGEGANATINAPAIAADPREAVRAAIRSTFPNIRKEGVLEYSHMKKAEEPFTLTPGAVRYGPNGELIAFAPEKTPATPIEKAFKAGDIRKFLEGASEVTQEFQKDGTWKEISRGSRKEGGETRVSVAAPVTPVTVQDPSNPNRTIVVDGRTGRKIGDGPKLTQIGGAEQKLELSLPQARQRVESITQNMDKLDKALTELLADPALTRITGTFMGRTPNLTNTATGAQGQLNTIKSQIFQSSLQAMREASKTGGAVGNVSDREGDKLERTLASLDQMQGTPEFKKQMQIAIEQVRRSKEIINNAFQEQYGGVQGRNSSPAPAGIDPAVWNAMTPAEKALWK